MLTSVLTRELGAKRTVKEAKSQEEEAEKGFTEVTSAQRINGELSWFGREKGKYFYETSNEQKWASLVAQTAENPPAMQETRDTSLTPR